MDKLDPRVERGLAKLLDTRPVFDERRRAYAGEHDLPFAPQGASAEYMELRKMAALPLVRLAVRTASQRLRSTGVRTSAGEEFDRGLWRVWAANRMRSRARIPYVDGLRHDRGIVAVWPNPRRPEQPVVRPESPESVWVEPDPADPFSSIWAIKRWTEADERGRPKVVVVLYTAKEWVKFSGSGDRQLERVDGGTNPLGAVPFVTYVPEIDSLAEGTSYVDALMPAQRAVDTMRFNVLLAAQFAAFRQRIATGYDPVVKDDNGDPVPMTDSDGEPILDEHGQAVAMIKSPGKVGVDRMLVFPGVDTKVFDLAESNLSNYITVLEHLIATFASTAQVPPQYLVGDFKNVSGDLMLATEATLTSFVDDLQTSYGESDKEVFRLIDIARGGDGTRCDDLEVDWAPSAPEDAQQVASAAAQMVPNGAPLQMFLERMPGANPRTVERWMKMAADELQRALGGDFAAAVGEKPAVGEGLEGLS
ncbi:phage portal protein [Dietzia sp. MNB45]|uniref:phage portal protein n=1 Tax=Dietzia sp. MNB45 TaxID=3238800 RepID=UPI003F7D434E